MGETHGAGEWILCTDSHAHLSSPTTPVTQTQQDRLCLIVRVVAEVQVTYPVPETRLCQGGVTCYPGVFLDPRPGQWYREQQYFVVDAERLDSLLHRPRFRRTFGPQLVIHRECEDIVPGRD